jgi:alkylation response protein AidB-like acyl-CoA dehydrogenase
MEFRLTEEQRMVQEMSGEFARKELEPLAGEMDVKGFFPDSLLTRMAELGLMCMMVPEEYGGAGLDTLSYSLALTEIAKACLAASTIMSVTNMVCDTIYAHGTEEQKRSHLPPIQRGDYVASFALTEPQAGSDASNLLTTARREGDDYIVNGRKQFTTSGSRAGISNLMAVTDKTAGSRGISTFILPMEAPGLTVGKVEDKMGLRASDTVELIMEDCLIPARHILGGEGEGFVVAMVALDGGRIGIASQSVGLAQACLEAAINYARERTQFGRPIAEFQAIQWMLADTATEIDAAKLLVQRASLLRDAGVSFGREASMAKLYASEMANRAAYRALQVHGGYGYIKEYPVERYYRDARVTTIYEGTSEVQRMVIARSLLQDAAE